MRLSEQATGIASLCLRGSAPEGVTPGTGLFDADAARCINGDGRPMYDGCRCLCCRACHRLLCDLDCCD
jgi:hypothetical protein